MSLWTINFAVATNEDWRDSISLVTNPGESDEAPYDLTGSSFSMQLRNVAESLRVVLDLSTDNGRIIVADPETDGNLSIFVPREVIDDIGPGMFVHDIVWTRGDGAIVNLAAGTVTFTLGVTR